MPLPRVAKLCGAYSRRTGQPCKNPAMENGRCRMHGGGSLSGWIAPNFQHGQYSQYLFDRLIGMGRVAFHDTMIHCPERFARIAGRLEVQMNCYLSRHYLVLAGWDRERIEQEQRDIAAGILPPVYVKLSPQERKKKRLTEALAAKDRHRGDLGS